MTQNDLRKKLESLSHEEMDKFRTHFGGEGTIDHYVREFARHPDWEAKLFEILSMETEVEKRRRIEYESLEAMKREADATVQAAISAAEANRIAAEANTFSKQAVEAARWGNVISWIALVIAVIAAVIALLDLLK